MIEITTWTDGRGRDHAQCGTQTANSAAGLARLLVAGGTPDGPWRTVTRTGTISLSGRSLFALAAVQAVETDTGMTWVRYRPHPRNPAPPLLAEALATVRLRSVQPPASGREPAAGADTAAGAAEAILIDTA